LEDLEHIALRSAKEACQEIEIVGDNTFTCVLVQAFFKTPEELKKRNFIY
jgi:acid stress-induced BolA-like protein IbaG/YrbA